MYLFYTNILLSLQSVTLWYNNFEAVCPYVIEKHDTNIVSDFIWRHLGVVIIVIVVIVVIIVIFNLIDWMITFQIYANTGCLSVLGLFIQIGQASHKIRLITKLLVIVKFVNHLSCTVDIETHILRTKELPDCYR